MANNNQDSSKMEEFHYNPLYASIEDTPDEFERIIKEMLEPGAAKSFGKKSQTPYSDALDEIRKDVRIFLARRCFAGLNVDIHNYLNGSKAMDEGLRITDEMRGDELLQESFQKTAQALEAVAAEAKRCYNEKVCRLSVYNELVREQKKLMPALRCIVRIYSILVLMDELKDTLQETATYLSGTKLHERIEKEVIPKVYDDIKQFNKRVLEETPVDPYENYFSDLARELQGEKEKLQKEYEAAKLLDAKKIADAFKRIVPAVPDTEDCDVILDGKTGMRTEGTVESLEKCAVITTQLVYELLRNPKVTRATLSVAWLQKNGFVSEDAECILVVHNGYAVDKINKAVKPTELENVYFSAQAYRKLGF